MQSLILGGTKGLGRALAVESLKRNIPTTVVGRTPPGRQASPEMVGAAYITADLSQSKAFADPHILSALTSMVLPETTHIFWVAGMFLRKPLTDCTTQEVIQMTATHFTGPVSALQIIHRIMKTAKPLSDNPGQPYHLVTIASTSSYRERENESLYCALKAAKAHFTRTFAKELIRDLPGSKVTLVNPGGLKTSNFWKGVDQDIANFMDPAAVANMIWDEVLGQTTNYLPLAIERNPDGSPRLFRGEKMPESPF